MKLLKFKLNTFWFLPFGKNATNDWYPIPTLLLTTTADGYGYNNIKTTLFTLCWIRMGIVTLSISWSPS